ncbi:HAD-IA family hydrolase [Candidatus Saccharibacteria bacterium]|nr:HAD-IA family hydrolase [Candidatus Saccharibacteria bacterium]
MIKAIVFDCFGVLAEDAWLPFKRQYIGNDLSLATQIADLGKQNEYGFITNNEYFRSVSDLLGVPEPTLKRALTHKVPNAQLLAYITATLTPHFKIGLLSNANFDVVTEIFNKDQAQIFDATALSYECGLIKPDPRIFELIANRLGVLPSECILVDDVERYCTAAEQVGMKSIVYQNTDQTIADINQFL